MPWVMLFIRATRSSPGKAIRPVTSSYNTAPRLKMSARRSTFLASRICSGAM
jgi:hypothetical protein